jgi:hypothetical protein
VEVSKETEVGTDLTFNINPKGSIFKTLNLSATYWQRSSANVIYSVALPPTTGATGQLTNAIDMSSKGFQFNLSVPIIQSKNWNWDFNALYGHSVSMIDKIAGGASIPLTSAAGSTQILLVQGKRIGQIYAYKTFRSLDQTRQDGTPYIDKADRGKYAIVNGTVIDTATKGIMFTDETYPIGDGNPRFNMSFINSISYKGFVTLGWQFDWVSGQHLYNQTKEWMYRDGISGDFDKAVYFPNTGETSARTAYWASAYYGLWGSTRGVGNNATKDFFYEDASFVRLRNISLSFNFTRMLNIKAVKSLQLVLSGRNIATFTKYTGFDPEINSGSVNSSFDRGIDHSTLPNTKAYQVGINVGF